MDNDNSLRPDGSKKGTGYFGPVPRPDGRVSTELTFLAHDENGNEVTGPYITPNVDYDQMNELLNLKDGEHPSAGIRNKAMAYAIKRQNDGLSPYWQKGEQVYDVPKPQHIMRENLVRSFKDAYEKRLVSDGGLAQRLLEK